MPEQLVEIAEAIRAQVLAFAPDSVADQIRSLPPVAIVAALGVVALLALWIVLASLGALFGGDRRRDHDEEESYEPRGYADRRHDAEPQYPDRAYDAHRDAANDRLGRSDPAPQAPPPQRNFSGLYEDLSVRADRLIQNNDLPAALATAREALDVARQAAFQQPESVGPQRLVAKALHRVGDLSGRLGDAHGARQNHEQALVLLRRLQSANPRDVAIARELAVTLERVGTAATQSGDRSGARAMFEEELRIASQMAAQEQGDLSWVRFKAVVHIMLGNLNEHDHRAHYEQARQLFETLERANVIQAQDSQTLQQLRGVLQA